MTKTNQKFNCTLEVARWFVFVLMLVASAHLAHKSSQARHDKQQREMDARQLIMDKMEAINLAHQEELDRRGEWMQIVERHIESQTSDRFRGSDFTEFLKLNPDLKPIPIPDPNTD